MNTSNDTSNRSGVFRQTSNRFILTLLTALCLIARCQAQGTIAFNNLANNDPTMAAQSGGLVHMWTGSDLSFELLNADINFALYESRTADFSSLYPVHTWLLSDGSASGISVGGGHFADPSGGVYTIPGVAPGSEAYIGIAAWTGNYTSYEAALAAGSMTACLVQFWNPTGGGGTPAASMLGMPALDVPHFVVPEPAPLALFLAGAGALLLWHRRRV